MPRRAQSDISLARKAAWPPTAELGDVGLRVLHNALRRAFVPATAGALVVAAMVSPISASSGLADTGTVVLTNNVLQGLSSLTPVGDTSPGAGMGVGIGLQG